MDNSVKLVNIKSFVDSTISTSAGDFQLAGEIIADDVDMEFIQNAIVRHKPVGIVIDETNNTVVSVRAAYIDMVMHVILVDKHPNKFRVQLQRRPSPVYISEKDENFDSIKKILERSMKEKSEITIVINPRTMHIEYAK